MNGLLDGAVVALILAASATYAAAALAPAAWRRRGLAWLAALLLSRPKVPGFSAAGLRLQAASRKAAGGCDACAGQRVHRR